MVISIPEGLERWLYECKWTPLNAKRVGGGYAADLYELTIQTELNERIEAVYKSFAAGRNQELYLYKEILPCLADSYAPIEIGRIESNQEQGILLMNGGTVLKSFLSAQPPEARGRTVVKAAEFLADMHIANEQRAETMMAEGRLQAYPVDSSMQWGADAIAAVDWLVQRGLASVQSPHLEKLQYIIDWFYPKLETYMQGRSTITHGDPHFFNILVNEGRFVLIDWEFICVTVPQRDMAIFLQDILDPTLNQSAKTAYYEALAKAGWPVDVPSFEATFQACFLDNTLMMLGWEVHKFREGHLTEQELAEIVSTKLRWIEESYHILRANEVSAE